MRPSPRFRLTFTPSLYIFSRAKITIKRKE
nr:MAG TPA: hypothetical protein [Caudoviricetes sp.]DAK50666.1 MAG TPA: hypothetical protein [Caudoviricetes sp.]DAN01438.1 MAG TPA: hypothetical protein [Caudoviricetes sp.]DAS55855.1 MAG TPA: hypothetical protein [Caudoviricetes sp.]